jgi:bacillithiol biosynthesis cysteine-adding enzyme BshC
VPIFWMDSEDHDLAEVAQFARLSAGAVERIDARPALFPGGEDGAARPVGDVRLPGAIQDLARDLLAALPDSPSTTAMRGLLDAAYRPGRTFTEAFARLLSGLLSPFPIALFDPHDPATKPLLAPLFRNAVARADALHAALQERNTALERSGFHTQVHVAEGSTVLFLSEGPERRAVARQENGFALKGSSTRFTAAELRGLAEKAPERFSPNVLLRPIVQDTLFPTAAYVAGPAEVAYLAQVAPLYGLLGRPMPIVWPRASFTLLGAETVRDLDGAGLELEHCMAGKHRVVETLIAAGGRTSSTAIVKRLARLVETEMAALRPAVAAAEASLGSALDTAARKILHQVAALETKLVHFEARHDRTILDRADAILERCYPDRNLQERQLGIVPVVAVHGMETLPRIDAAIELDRFVHRILDLGDP